MRGRPAYAGFYNSKQKAKMQALNRSYFGGYFSNVQIGGGAVLRAG